MIKHHKLHRFLYLIVFFKVCMQQALVNGTFITHRLPQVVSTRYVFAGERRHNNIFFRFISTDSYTFSSSEPTHTHENSSPTLTRTHLCHPRPKWLLLSKKRLLFREHSARFLRIVYAQRRNHIG